MNIVFDIGGTKMRIARSTDDVTLSDPVIIPTPQSWRDGIAALTREIQNVSEGRAIRAIAGGIAGVLNQGKTHLTHAENLPDWALRPIADELSREFHAQVFLENDSALGGLGEATTGAGEGKQIVAYLAIGTGIGGSRIVDGKIDAARYGFEPGHQIIDWRMKIELERLVSGGALEARHKVPPSEIHDPAVWNECADMLAVGVANAILHWAPDIVVLGGFLSGLIPIDRVREGVRELISVFPELPAIVPGVLKDRAGLFGCLALIAQHNLS